GAGRSFSGIALDYAVNILDRPERRNAAQILALMGADDAARLLHGMSDDRVVDVLLELDGETRARLVFSLDEPVRIAI
ncbi:magnesium transporter MgtE N-terminal domain-containing protein, partial [Rhizobium ruizarguesonis]